MTISFRRIAFLGSSSHFKDLQSVNSFVNLKILKFKESVYRKSVFISHVVELNFDFKKDFR